MINQVIPIGTSVEVHNEMNAKIHSISIYNTHIEYNLINCSGEDIIYLTVQDWEITSIHNEKTIIRQCLERVENA